MRFEVITEKITEERGTVEAYGIQIWFAGYLLHSVAAITTCRAAVEGLLALCEDYGLSVHHAADVLEDFVMEQYLL